MNVTFACPRCQESSRVELTPADAALRCADCQAEMPVTEAAFSAAGLQQCLVCGSRDLFVRKDFPQRLGVAIVVTGFIASSIAWSQYMTVLTFAILFATALIDVVLYLLVGEALECYRCHTQYRTVEGIERHGAFNLQTHERYRQLAARIRSQ
jgi:hypothetical protein